MESNGGKLGLFWGVELRLEEVCVEGDEGV